MDVCTPTASLRYEGNRALSSYSRPAKTQQAQKAIDLSLYCATLANSLKDSIAYVAPFVDEQLIPEQAGLRPEKSCTSQLLNLAQLIEDGYEEGIITAFFQLSGPQPMTQLVNHIILARKFFEITQDARLSELIQNMLSNRRFSVVLVGKRSIWRRQKNGLPQDNVLASVLFNICTNDQPVHPKQGVSCAPMIYAFPHRSNPVRRWNRLLVMHLKA